MDLGCANRVRVRKSLCITILRTRFSVADFGGLESRRVRDFCWDFTECDLRTLGAICVGDLRTRFAYSTRFYVLDSNFRALLFFEPN